MNQLNNTQQFDYYVVGINSEYLPNCKMVGTPLSVEFADRDVAKLALAHIKQAHPEAKIWGYSDLDGCGKHDSMLGRIRQRDAHYRDKFNL